MPSRRKNLTEYEFITLKLRVSKKVNWRSLVVQCSNDNSNFQVKSLKDLEICCLVIFCYRYIDTARDLNVPLRFKMLWEDVPLSTKHFSVVYFCHNIKHGFTKCFCLRFHINIRRHVLSLLNVKGIISDTFNTFPSVEE